MNTNLKIVNTILLSFLFLNQAYAAPTCSPGVKDNGDGWGWENHRSCRISNDSSSSNNTPSNNDSNCIDKDGDGWGWNGTGSCRVDANSNPSSASTSSSTSQNSSNCVDKDGDGWGWDGTGSCRVDANSNPSSVSTSSSTSQNSSNCVDKDGDGWGWDGTKSCRATPSIAEANTNSSENTTTPVSGNTPLEKHGKLKVCWQNSRPYLCNKNNNPVQLTGMSSHGINWYGWKDYDDELGKIGCLSESSLNQLGYSWETDIFRIAMYVKSNGYESNKSHFRRHVNKLVAELEERGMYAIIDFHILSGHGASGNPMDYLDTAKQFFKDIVQDNKHRTNVLYEIANEPVTDTWQPIKQYADEIVQVIRNNENSGNHAPIIVGTRAWSSLAVSHGGTHQEILDDPVIDSVGNNLMYTFHFYAGEHHQKYLEELYKASEVLPIFVTEWGTTQASGGGGNDFNWSRKYIDLMKDKKIGWTAWNFSAADEASAMWTPTNFCSDKNANWGSNSNFTPSGKWIKDIFYEHLNDISAPVIKNFNQY